MSANYSPTEVFLEKLSEEQRNNSLKELQTYLSVEHLELTDHVENGIDHFSGKSDLLYVDCQMESLIGPNGSYFLIAAQPNEDWKFGKAFPDLPGKEMDDQTGKEIVDQPEEEMVDQPGTFFLRSLSLENPLWLYIGISDGTSKETLISAIKELKLYQEWNQVEKEKLLQELDLAQNSGLYLWGNIPVLPDPLNDVFNFLGDSAKEFFKLAILKGSVTIPSTNITHIVEGEEQVLYAAGYPLLTLGVALGKMDFGSSDVTLNGLLEFSSPLYFSSKNSAIGLKGDLQLPGLDQHIVAEINFPIDSDTIKVSGTYSAGLPFVDPDTLPNKGTATLGALVLLEFSKSTKSLTKMAFGASMQSLTFFDDKLIIDDLSLFFQIYDPLFQLHNPPESGLVTATASMQATAFLGKSKSLEMSLGGSYPDGRLYLQMQNASLREVISDLDITDNVDHIPDLRVSLFNVEYNYQLEFFAAQLLVEGQWEIAEWLILEELRFGVSGTSGELELGFSTGFILADTPMQISAVYASREGVKNWQFSAGMVSGETMAIGKMIENLATKFGSMHIPNALAELTIHDLYLSFDGNEGGKHFFFTTNLLFPVAENELDLTLTIEIEKRETIFTKRFGGTILIADLVFDVIINQSGTDTSFLANFDSSDGLELNPLDLLNKLNPTESFDFGDDSDKMGIFNIYHLGFFYESVDGTTPYKQYTFTGIADWEINLPIGDNDTSIRIGADVKFIKKINTPDLLEGSYIKGSLDTSDDEFLSILRLGVTYHFGDNPRLTIEAEIGGIILLLDYEVINDEKIFTISTAASDESKKLSFGSIITFLVGLVDPSVDDFQLDPPWDTLNQIELSGFTFEINTTAKTVTVNYEKTIELGFMTIDSLGISYARKKTSSGKSKGEVTLKLSGSLLGVSKDLAWDPINETPPEVPGQGAAVFDLRYLGLGQRIAFTQAANVSSIKEVMDLLRGVIDENEIALSGDRSLKLRNPLDTFGDGGPISFSPESEWLIGLDVSLLKTLSLSVIFNDPVIYGLRIELYGKHAKNFAGLQFEILYQKISPTIGKYHVDLTLPDFVRNLQFGAVSVTLPIIVVDIFTNGDFKIDLGFPWNFNYARSFALEVGIFTGAGGFYFNKLSAATATSTPAVVPEKGVFTPVYEFGLGLKIGLGRSFNKGPLKAEISITVQGIVEGVISWYNPADGGDRELYYKISGGIAIVGRLYGEADFGIISVSVEVIARAMIQFLVEVYQPILIDLTAEVSVKAKVKVAFITVRFSFSLTVKQSFTIDSPQSGTAPWLT